MGNRKKVRKSVQTEKTFNGGGANIKAINSHRDVDSEDDLEATQDKILLDGQKRDFRAVEGDVEASDEEVLALSGLGPSDEDEDEEGVLSDSDEHDAEVEEEEDGWGEDKREYYNADEISDEEDQKAEEEEALRIQKRNLAKLDASAYVEDLNAWKDDEDDKDTEGIMEELPSAVSTDLPESELLKILHTRHPEFAPFATEFKTLRGQLEHLGLLAQRTHHPQHPILSAKLDALRSYLTVLAFYFVLMSSEQAKSINIKEHEIMVSLVRCRQAWHMMETVKVDETLSDVVPVALDTSPKDPINAANKPRKRKRSSKSSAAAIASVPVVESYAPVQDDELEATFRALKSVTKKRKTAMVPDLADNVADSVEAEDAAARRKTLQFYASQINSKSARRTAAQQSGDLDIPYRERRKERELRLQAEAERRQGGTAGADLDNAETGPREDDADPDEEYYQLIASAAKAQKAEKKQEHDGAVAAVRAERAGYALPDQLDGKRKIGRDIAANKGLTVNRPKENRNARVKKRNKYDAAKKKLGSQKAIFKQPTGSYGGESSGINARVIKSTKMDQGSNKKR